MMSLVGQNTTIQDQSFAREWFISFKDPMELWTEHWFALALEVISAAILLQLFRNARKTSPESAYLLLAGIFAGISVELLALLPNPGYVLWWYHQGVVNVVKQRVPSYVISVYTLILYMADSLTRKTNLPMFARSVLTAICATLIMSPCLWFGPRLLLLVLHFDDAVFKDQIAGIPYVQLIVTLLNFFHTSYLLQQYFEAIEPHERNTNSYIKFGIQSGLLSGIYAMIEQYLLTMFFTLTLRVSAVVSLVAALLILLYLARADIKEKQMTSYSIQGIITPLMRKEFWTAVAAMVFISSLPLWLNVQNLKSNSIRLEMGPCHISHDVFNTSPIVLSRRRYICPDDVNILHFDFHCLSRKEIIKGVKKNTNHYTICGKEFENSTEVAKNWMLYSAFCLALFYIVMLVSFTFKIQEKKKTEIYKKAE